MILKAVLVWSFKSVSDSGRFVLDSRVSCLVGKNESGTTAILEAIYRMKPLPGRAQDFDALRDYPRRTYKKIDPKKIAATCPIEVTFHVDDDDAELVADEFAEGVITPGDLEGKKSYENKSSYG